MTERVKPGQISIEHATRRGVVYLDAASGASAQAEGAPSGRADIARPSDGVVDAFDQQFARSVSELVRGGLDNHRGIPPEKSDSKAEI